MGNVVLVNVSNCTRDNGTGFGELGIISCLWKKNVWLSLHMTRMNECGTCLFGGLILPAGLICDKTTATIRMV
jgi:hypothetical protein